MGIAETRARRIATGVCRDCGGLPLAPTKIICAACSDKRKARQSARAEKLKQQGICIQCKAVAKPNKTLCEKCMKNVTDTGKARRKKNKLAVIEKFGGKCFECQERDPRTLTLDHVNNDGNVECAGNKKRIRSSDFYARLLADNKVRTDLQLLCFNCHAKKDLFYDWE